MSIKQLTDEQLKAAIQGTEKTVIVKISNGRLIVGTNGPLNRETVIAMLTAALHSEVEQILHPQPRKMMIT